VPAKFFQRLGLVFLAASLIVIALLDFSLGRILRNQAAGVRVSDPKLTMMAIRPVLWAACLLIFVFGIIVWTLSTRSLARRIERLKEFAGRVARGDFHPLPLEHSGGELEDLTVSLNETAGRLYQTIQSLTEERNRSSAILGSMVEGVAVMDAAERLVFCNRAFAGVLGVDASRAEGRPLIETIRQPELLEALRQSLQRNEVVHSEVSLGTMQPQVFAIAAAPLPPLANADAIPAASGATAQARGAVIVLHDITELRRLERVRRDFVANVSHEFKTPLTAIQGFAETLLAGALEDQRNNRKFVEIIRDQSMRLARLTDDLLKLARIEAGKLELESHLVAADTLVQSCVEAARMEAHRKNITVSVETPIDLPLLDGDQDGLREVLQNLLDNAVHYTPPGGRVTVRAERQGNLAVLSVEDTGIGIPQAEHERIFERFYRVDAARSREAGGTGLGLSIAKHIVEAYDGRIWVESEVGAGSAFRFTVPLQAADSFSL
jgi:two-component system phosphate regulon sensor histidine kinase PhoR